MSEQAVGGRCNRKHSEVLGYIFEKLILCFNEDSRKFCLVFCEDFYWIGNHQTSVHTKAVLQGFSIKNSLISS